MTTRDRHGTSRAAVAGAVITTFRAEMGWSQEETASRLGMDRSALSRLEVGRTVPRIDDIFALDALFAEARLIHGHGDLLLLTARAIEAIAERPADVAGPEQRRVVSGVVDRWLRDLRADADASRGQKSPPRCGLQGEGSRGQ